MMQPRHPGDPAPPRLPPLDPVLWLVLAADAVVLLATALGDRRDQLTGIPALLVHQLRLQSENVVGVWYASMLLLLAGLCFAAAAGRAHANSRDPWRVLGFAGLAAMMAALSLDELGSLHERFEPAGLPNPFGSGTSWVGIVAIPGGIALVAVAVFGWRLAREDGRVFWLLTAAAALLATVPLQELVELRLEERRGLAGAVLEEGTELAAATLLVAAALAALGPAPSLRWIPPPSRRLASGVLVASAAGAVAAFFAVESPLSGGLGKPFQWFLAAPMFVAGVSVFGRVPGSGRVGLGVACLAMSADAGASAALTTGIYSGSPTVRLALDALLLAGAAVVAYAAGRGRRDPGTATAASLWGIAAVAWVLAPFPWTWVAALAACGLAATRLAGRTPFSQRPANQSTLSNSNQG